MGGFLRFDLYVIRDEVMMRSAPDASQPLKQKTICSAVHLLWQ
jgi:hypothetical protein